MEDHEEIFQLKTLQWFQSMEILRILKFEKYIKHFWITTLVPIIVFILLTVSTGFKNKEIL